MPVYFKLNLMVDYATHNKEQGTHLVILAAIWFNYIWQYGSDGDAYE